ncbi:VCBS repeat-containing protein [Cellulophaga tyrosinoxydans]|uniref:Repeat domain-containing protein n=1 Tax=Cellulophaga tyrosinoxydans TaxID=504486 RepID=A0A1W1Z8K9_9FLAO|nr:VCBS repeat-containing protein [Cellulophaga tyrosinoxydans]SMC44714.1 Repeat domain-containing protein [Cellulophaga tyrosinoxydans]
MKLLVVLCISICISCSRKQEEQTSSLFSLKNNSIGINFENKLTYTEDFNPYVYRNFYNGGGVAIGDINNDGLNDIYFTGNQVENKLYLNKGNWQFEDITDKANVACKDVWSSGATFADVNGDGFIDLYVCKSGKPGGENRHNELFINNGDLTFTESSKQYGLDVEGLSVQAAFFDFDKDGDLDCYVLNNSIKSIGAFDLIKDQRNVPDPNGSGNKFFRNDEGVFVDITKEANIFSSKIGFGLGITLGDFNDDNWTDIFISNDFFEKDYLYINNQKGGFSEELEKYFSSISMGSMGADLADLNNDSFTDLMVTEMLPTTEERKKTKTMFESWNKQQLAKKQGYYDQYSRNTLQRNLGNNSFLEIGRQAQVAATEWSWSTLIFDMDNSGLRDIYVSNGIYKDLLDRDYLTYEANDETIRNRVQGKEKDIIKKLIDAMPSKAIVNGTFQNLGDFKFKETSKEWGLDQPSFSNGSAYGDLDNDGDLDLVINNVNMPAFVYENNTDTLTHRSVYLKFKTNNKNTKAIGAQAQIFYNNGETSFGENYTSRGFQSNVADGIHFGLGTVNLVDSIHVQWPNGKQSRLINVPTNQSLTLTEPTDYGSNQQLLSKKRHKIVLSETLPLANFSHEENSYNDFNNERLIPQMYSNEGPALASFDLNSDGDEDFFIGGAKNQCARLFISSKNGYQEISDPFKNDSPSEDVDAVFFDGDNDGDMDLYVAHGGKAFSPYSIALNDSYYKNENNNFTKVSSALTFSKTISSSVVKVADFDNDGDTDLFVGERYKTNLYGAPCSGFLLENNGYGNFKIFETNVFNDIGMITDASWTDINNDGWEDLIVVGEWMSVKIYLNKKGKFTDSSELYGLANSSGIWTSLELADVDNDGDQDLIIGNIGLNNFFEPNMRMFVGDFDGNGFKEQIICKKVNDEYYPIVDKDELISQIPSLKKKLLYYKDYGKATIQSLFSEKILSNILHFDLNTLESTVYFNQNGKFISKALPSEIQYAPVYTITTEDIDNDGNLDLFFGGNQFLVKPQFGKYDASKGWIIFGSSLEDKKFKEAISLQINGQIRALKWLDYKNKKIALVAKNNEKLSFYTY